MSKALKAAVCVILLLTSGCDKPPAEETTVEALPTSEPTVASTTDQPAVTTKASGTVETVDPTDAGDDALDVDPTPPSTVTSVGASSANGAYKSGQMLSFTVEFSVAVNVTGTPRLTLETGATDQQALYASGNGTTTLVFSYSTLLGDVSPDLDYISTTALAVNSGTIKNATGIDATLLLPAPGTVGSLGANADIVVDTEEPMVTDITSSTVNGIYAKGSTISIAVSYSEAVTVTGTPMLALETGSIDRTAVYSGGSGTSALTFNYIVQGEDFSSDLDYASTTSLTVGTSITDAAGNDAVLTLPSPGATGSLSANKGLKIDALTKVSAGNGHVCRRSPTGAVKCWGANDSGQLGIGNTNGIGDDPNEIANQAAVNLGTGRMAVEVFAGSAHTCVLLDNGSVKCWGENDFGQLGQGTTTYRGDGSGEMGDSLAALDLGTGKTATMIAVGSNINCALLNDSTVKCWGYGGNGALGQGNANFLGDQPNELGDNLTAVNLGTGRTAIQLFSKNAHMCAMLDNSTVKCWGYGSFGLLGHPDAHIGDGSNEMGDNLATLDIGSGRTVTQIATGYYQTCARLDNGTAKCWGRNANGALGQGHIDNLGNDPGEMGDALPIVNFGTGRTIKHINAGFLFACAILDNDATKCWGDNSEGQLGKGHINALGDGGSEMGDLLLAIDLGSGRVAKQISAGNGFACAVLDDASVKCWGTNGSGQLGQGSFDTLGNEPNEMGDNLPAINFGAE